MSARHVLASNLRKLLVSHGISSQTAAARAGMKGSQFSNYLNAKGPKGPSVEVLDRLAEAFHTTPAALLDDGREAPSVIIREVEHSIEECARRWAETTLEKSRKERDAVLDAYASGGSAEENEGREHSERAHRKK